MGRTAFAIVRNLVKRGEAIDAALLIRDMDDQPERQTGLGQARTEAQSWATFRIILGCATPKREAWVLCGFEPESDEERARLSDLRRELGVGLCGRGIRVVRSKRFSDGHLRIDDVGVTRLADPSC